MSDFTEQVHQILNGAVSFFIGYGLRKAVGLFTTIMLARLLTIDSFGVLMFGLSIIGITKKFGKLGSTTSFLKLIPKYIDNVYKQQKVITVGVTVTAIGALVTAGALFWYAPIINELSIGADQLPVVLRLLSFVMILEIFIDVCSSLLQSIKRPRLQVVIKDGIKPLFRNGSILLGLYFGSSIVGVTIALAIGFAVAFVISVLILLKTGDIWMSTEISREDIFEYTKFSIPLTFQGSASILYKQIDILMIGLLLVSADVSLFKVATSATAYLILPLLALNQIFTPLSSELYEKGKYEDISILYHVVTRWALTLSLFPAAAVVIYRQEVLSIFGSEYVAASTLMVAFILREIIINATGPSGKLLVMMSRQNYAMGIQWVFGILNVILNYILILRMGVLGAAIATVTTTILANTSRVGMVWYLENIHPFRIKMVKPFISLGPAAIGMYIISMNYTELTAILYGTALGGAMYLIGIYLIGIEKEDKDVFYDFVSE